MSSLDISHSQAWTDLLQVFNQRQLRNTFKKAYRRVGKKARVIAVRHLNSTGIQVKGRKSDWAKGIRVYPFSKGCGFMVTVSGGHGRSQHVNRRGIKKPILMWLEDGTTERKTRKSGVKRGAIRSYGFLQNSEPQMRKVVEDELLNELRTAVEKNAAKYGFV